MSTEYRRGIPSIAHVEAATRLGLLWGDNYSLDRRWHFEIRDGVFHSDFESSNVSLGGLRSGQGFWMPPAWVDLRPIRPDGTPVDWEMLDQEVARVGQPQTMACNLTASAQAHGFRADLWQRIRAHLANGSGCGLPDVSSLDSMGFRVQSPFFDAEVFWPQGTNPADILARWTVYQELKPLYDLVDGAQGEAAMPRDVEIAWYSASVNERRRAVGNWILARDVSGLLIKNNRNTVNWCKDEPNLGAPLRNFAAVLDAVAERRVAERMRGQTPTVTPAQPEPRRFADVRPDQHGWRWWRMWGSGCIPTGSSIECQPGLGWRMKSNSMYTFDWNAPNSSDADRTIIPTDEQGNPVSWEAAGFAAEAVRGAQESVQRAANDATPGRATHPPLNSVTVNGSAAQGWTVAEQAQTGHIVKGTVEIAQVSVSPSRFALIELDDADPTVERIRQEQEAERHRLAELRQQRAAERAAQPTEEMPTTTSRFDLIEPDPQADPTASIRTWEARQAAAKVRPMAAPPHIAKPAAAPRRPAIEVVDAEVDGLSRSEAFVALVGRAFNGGC